MAHPDIEALRKGAREAEQEMLLKTIALTTVTMEAMHGPVPMPLSTLASVEGAVDDLKASIVHLVNARQAVEFWEES